MADAHEDPLETAWRKARDDTQTKTAFLSQLSRSSVVVILHQPPGFGAAAPERNLVQWQSTNNGAPFVPVFTDVAHLTIPIPLPAQAVRVPMRVLLSAGSDQQCYVVNPLSTTPLELSRETLAQMRSLIEAQGLEARAPSRDAPWVFEFPDEALFPVAVALVTWFNAHDRVDSAYLYELSQGESPRVVLGLDLSPDPALAEILTGVAVAAGVDPDVFIVRFLPDEPSHRAGLAGIGLTPFYRRPRPVKS